MKVEEGLNKNKYEAVSIEDIMDFCKEIRAALYSVLSNLLYKRKDNAQILMKEKTILQFLMRDSRRSKEGNAELRTAAMGLLVGTLELLINDSVEVSIFT